jgi:stress-induced morphogen
MNDETEQVRDVLRSYESVHADAAVEVRSPNEYSIRIRIVDPDFEGVSRGDREPEVWRLLQGLPDDVFTRISMLLLLTPDEQADSLANREFDDPLPSRL